jgi:hypothetical protein
VNHDPDSCPPPPVCGKAFCHPSLLLLYLSFTVGVELSSDRSGRTEHNRRWFDLCCKGVEPVDVFTLWILATAGVVSVLLFTVRGILEQLPEVFAAWHRARRALRDRDAEGE